jgi:23S rRNA (pseudouridine1915-N3)-methyltransferase
MNIKLIVIGKTNQSYLVEAEQEYLKRLKRYVNFDKIEIPDLKNAKKLSEIEIKQEEGKLILKKISPGGLVVLLDDKGKSFTSMQFAHFLQDKMNLSYKQLTFVIGGAYGFSDEVYQLADQQLSLSKMTLSHQMIRIFFIEQVYRGFTILKNEPYHHE